MKHQMTGKRGEVWSMRLSALGVMLSVAGILVLIVPSLRAGTPWHIAGFLIYGFGLISVFGASALHHGYEGSERANFVLRQIDYSAIPIMIAGTATPFCLILLRNSFGWTVLAVFWVLALFLIVLKNTWPNVPRWLITSLFLGMGWMGVLLADPLVRHTGWTGVILAVAGGLFYSVGALIFLLEKDGVPRGRFGLHDVWHLFVLAGTATHFFLVYRYLLPV
ncbi:MAG: hemolysin III family protein [Elusimicrobiota bacterium]